MDGGKHAPSTNCSLSVLTVMQRRAVSALMAGESLTGVFSSGKKFSTRKEAMAASHSVLPGAPDTSRVRSRPVLPAVPKQIAMAAVNSAPSSPGMRLTA